MSCNKECNNQGGIAAMYFIPIVDMYKPSDLKIVNGEKVVKRKYGKHTREMLSINEIIAKKAL